MDRNVRSHRPPSESALRWGRALLWVAIAVTLALGLAVRVLDTLPAPPASAAAKPSVLYDRHGTPIAEIGPSVEHASLGLEDMAPALVDAVVAKLDPGFLDGGGVDASAYAAAARRASGDTATEPSFDETSGILRRYIEISRLRSDGTAAAVRELLLELRLARQLSRAEILERFLNVVYLGRGAYGVHAAADVWFGVPAADLTVTQAAYLASLIDDPLGVDAVPRADASATTESHLQARLARDRVLGAMYEQGYLIDVELATGRTTPVTQGIRAIPAETFAPGPEPQRHAGVQAYGLIRLLAKDAGLETAAAMVYADLAERYGPHRIVAGGLHITTSIDLPVQRSATAEINDRLAAGQSADAVVLDRSGDIRVVIGLERLRTSQAPRAVPTLARRPVSDLLGPVSGPMQPLVASDGSSTVISERADAVEIARAFSVLPTAGELRLPRVVLVVSESPLSGLLDQADAADRWRLERTVVLDAAALREARSLTAPLTLPSGVAGFGRRAVSAASGDEWFVGWTPHLLAAVRFGTDTPSAAVDHAGTAEEIFDAVLDPLHYAELTP